MNREQIYRNLGGGCGNTIAQTPKGMVDILHEATDMLDKRAEDAERVMYDNLLTHYIKITGKNHYPDSNVLTFHYLLGFYMSTLKTTKEPQMTTKEQIIVMQAQLDGKEIEYQRKGVAAHYWTRKASSAEYWDFDNIDYRIKPEPTKVPLTAADITPTTWIRDQAGTVMYKVIRFDNGGITCMVNEDISRYTYQYLLDNNIEISTTPDSFNWRGAYNLI